MHNHVLDADWGFAGAPPQQVSTTLDSNMTTKCYMCNSEASSREHAPPLCIFPEEKDMADGKNYRKNLITVPACADHNLRKSHDDEYLHLLIIHGYFNNPLANKQFKTKLTRAFGRRPALLAAFHNERTPVTVDGIETVVVSIDRERFERSIDMLLHALYYYVFSQCLSLKSRIHTPLLIDIEGEDADKINELVKNFCLAVRVHLQQKQQYGANPDIFWFKIDHNQKRNIVSCHMQFYGGFDIFATAND